MPETWANPGPDLLLELRGTRRRAGLRNALREAVRSGRLVPGTLLPSSRALAAELSLARNTVADAHGQLVAEGWLTARAGRGTWVGQSAGPRAGRADRTGQPGIAATTCRRGCRTSRRSRAPPGWPPPARR